MDFISFSFASLFVYVFANRLTIGRRKTELAYVCLLILVSALFYAWHIPSFLLILLSSAVIDYWAGLYLGRGAQAEASVESAVPSEWNRKLILVISLAVNLGLLFYFKYSDFALDQVRTALAHPKIGRVLRKILPGGEIPHLNIILPMGISFYTFASLSYTIDVYRREIQPVRSFWRFFLFICFFPHLVAGPIVRASMFLPQMEHKRKLRLRVFNEGSYLIIRGLFLKMVCADNLGYIVNRHWATGYSPGTNSGLLVIIAIMFSIQIFCDFEGYTSIARGVAYLLGFRLPENFNNPYIAYSFKNFWERWHITLSQWLRDYLYIPLGGNRGSKWRTYTNLLLVMVLGGLWHGANMKFIIWGAMHGLVLAVEKLLGFDRMAKEGGRVSLRSTWFVVVQITIVITWIFFRSASVNDAMAFLKNIASCNFSSVPTLVLLGCCFGVIPVALMHLRGFLVERKLLPESGSREKAILTGAMLYAILTCYGVSNAFIYFQF